MKEKGSEGMVGGPGVSYRGEFLSSANKALSSNPSITTKSKQTETTQSFLGLWMILPEPLVSLTYP